MKTQTKRIYVWVKFKTICSVALTALLLMSSTGVFSQTVVNSLSALKPYLDDDNANVKLAPGTYNIDASDLASGAWGYDVTYFDHFAKTVMHFSGNNSTYDFTGVTINFDTDLYTYYSSLQIWEMQITGNDNVLLNLTMVDDGSVYDAPSKGVTNIVMDGEDNRIEGFHVTVRGSEPYGYGDAFGKGGSYTIQHFKHSACLVRGESNHVLNCTFIQRAYGHCIFMQAARNPVIEGCYIEGEVRTTDDMLAEAGTGSAADQINFLTDWGYTLPAGYMMSLAEEGIRAYNAGESVINGVYYENEATSNPTVLNCTVIRMRGGVTLPHASGPQYVSGCVVRECQGAFQVDEGSIVNCSADCVYGPVIKSAYDSDSPTSVDITILPAQTSYYNGSQCVAYLGYDHGSFTFTGSEANVPSNLKIQMGGFYDGVGLQNGNASSQNNHTAYYLDFENFTNYPVDIPSGANYNTVESCGTVTNGGSNNSITNSSNCNFAACGNFDPYTTVEAEFFCSQSGIQVEGNGQSSDNIGFIQDGDWISFDDVEFGNGASSFEVSASSSTSGGAIELRLGSTSGTLIGTCNISGTGSWSTWVTSSCTISGASGTQDLYLVFTGGSGYLYNLDHFEFTASGNPGGTNVALNKSASQFSNFSNTQGLAGLAVDGDTNGAWSNGSVTHTTTTTNPWWEVDLGGTYDIDDIVVFNRTDNCCMARLTYFTVSVLNGSTTTFSQSFTSYPDPSVSISVGGATGDIVRVQLNDTNPLSLAEVEVYGTASTGGSSGGDFQLVKRNSTGFAIDGGSTLEGRSVELYTYVQHNNLTWTEIDRGGGYYSYQKYGSNLCMDGGDGGADGQDVTTEVCSSSDYNQHWLKVDAGSGHYRLEKRGTNFSIDGGNNGGIDQNVYLWTSNSANQNQQWRFDDVSSSRFGQGEYIEEVSKDRTVSMYPNPVTDILNIDVPESTYNQLAVYGINGEVVHKLQIENDIQQLSVDFQPFNKGMYVLILSGNQSYETMKVVK